MKLSHSMLWTALLCGAMAAQAGDVAPAAAPAKASSGSAAKPVGSKPGGAAPVAGGNGGGLSSNGGNTGTQVGPKKPRCPDPTNTTACPAEKVIGK